MKYQNRGFFIGEGRIDTLPVKNAARSPLLGLNVGRKIYAWFHRVSNREKDPTEPGKKSLVMI